MSDDTSVPLTEPAGAEHPGVDSPLESVDIVTRPETVTKQFGMIVENAGKDFFINTNDIEDQRSGIDDQPGEKLLL